MLISSYVPLNRVLFALNAPLPLANQLRPPIAMESALATVRLVKSAEKLASPSTPMLT